VTFAPPPEGVDIMPLAEDTEAGIRQRLEA